MIRHKVIHHVREVDVFMVDVDPKKLIMVFDHAMGVRAHEHRFWCLRNCQHNYYNECDEYSYMCFYDIGDAMKFALHYGVFDSEQEKMWAIMSWS